MTRVYDSTMAKAAKFSLRPDERRELGEIAAVYQRRLDRLAREKGRCDRKHLAGKILKSFGAKVCAVVRTVEVRDAETPPTLEQLKARAAALNPLRPIPEAVTLKLQPKMGGGHRHVVAFGWKRRALQKICCDILTATLPVQPFDYLTKGKGVDAALLHLKKLIEEYDAQFVVTIDIKDCFGSVIKKKVAPLLPLPRWAVNNVLMIQDGVAVVAHPGQGVEGDHSGHPSPAMTSDLEAYEAARRGLPQGSSASGLIMYGAVLGPALRAVSFADRLVLYGDDLAVPVKDKTEAEAILKTLRSLLEASPVGPLLIGRETTRHIKEGVDFLSYRVVKKPSYYGGHLHIRPSARSYKRVEERAAHRFLKFGGGAEGRKQVLLYVKRWIAALRLWRPNRFSRRYLWLTMMAGAWHAGQPKK